MSPSPFSHSYNFNGQDRIWQRNRPTAIFWLVENVALEQDGCQHPEAGRYINSKKISRIKPHNQHKAYISRAIIDKLIHATFTIHKRETSIDESKHALSRLTTEYIFKQELGAPSLYMQG